MLVFIIIVFILAVMMLGGALYIERRIWKKWKKELKEFKDASEKD